ncbi:hypothetical protein [Cohnella sp. GCM10027633]|uniref:hypothetical protein n=1 Tax=unclassified Cohnella TaxID=2636738 RepID=UPI0036454A84
MKDEVQKKKETKDFIWMLVGNVIPAGIYEVNNNQIEIEGTKHFKPGSKVFSSPIQWGDGYERTYVIARHKENQKYIAIIMETRLITNWRIQKVYTPYILRKVKELPYHWNNSDKSRDEILEMLKWLPQRSLKS